MKKFVGAAFAAAALLVSATAANAATVYQSTFQGATFTITQNSDTNLTFDIAGANALSGDWAGAQYLGAFSFKGLGGATALTATLVGGGASANAIAGGLAAGGCNGKGAGFVCFDFTPNVAANAAHLTFDINATSGVFDLADAGPHLKIFWSSSATVDSNKTKVGSLYSQDVPFSHDTVSSAVPEPATWAMMITGFGLAGAAIRRRRQTYAHA